MNNFKKYLPGSYFVIIYLILLTVLWGSHSYIFPFMLFLSSLISYLLNKTRTSKLTSVILYLPFTLVMLVTCFLVNDFSRGLMYIVFVPVFTYIGAFLVNGNKKIILFSSTVLIFLLSFYVFPFFFNYCLNRDSDKNIAYEAANFLDKNGISIKLNKNKVIVLDFWTSNCSICFKKFPEFQFLKEKYKENKEVEFYAVNVPINDENYHKNKIILDQFNYDFNQLFAISSSEVESKLKFNTYPHTIIIKNNRIRFEGFLFTEKSSGLFNIDGTIDKLLNENY